MRTVFDTEAKQTKTGSDSEARTAGSGAIQLRDAISHLFIAFRTCDQPTASGDEAERRSPKVFQFPVSNHEALFSLHGKVCKLGDQDRSFRPVNREDHIRAMVIKKELLK